MMRIDPELEPTLGEGQVEMADIFSLPGQVYRHPPGIRRRTLRFELAGRGYFLKRHWGVGWREIFKELLSGRWPVLGAMNEWRAIQRLESLGVETMRLVAYGRKGWNPARLHSFVITAELEHCISLEDYTRDWARSPPPVRLKWALLRRLAETARTLHEQGLNHRDFYLCHFLLQQPWSGRQEDLHLYLIDLHRVQIRGQTPRRWRIKDLGALYFSAMDCGLSKRDLLRFIRHYRGQDPRLLFPQETAFWQEVTERAERLYRHKPFILDLERRPEVELADGSRLDRLCPVRVLPGKRWVGSARREDREVFVKLYQDPERGAIHGQREQQGLLALRERGVPTPELLYSGTTREEGWPVILLEHLRPALSFASAWQEAWNDTERKLWLHRLVRLLAEHHALGLCQTDLHLDNFLVSGDRLLTLDGAGIRVGPPPLPRDQALDNLALLIAQLVPAYEAWVPSLVTAYNEGRDGTTALDVAALPRRVALARERRWREIAGKLLRECSQFAYEDSGYGFQVALRHRFSPALESLLKRPDASFPGPDQALKNGHTCTLWRTRVDDRDLVVKRYNPKGFFHGLKQRLFQNRAIRSWRNAHRLAFLGIPTAQPLALVVQRRRWWQTTAYFISEHVPGVDARTWFREPARSEEEQGAMAERLVRLLQQLGRHGLGHGDLKASNLLIHHEEVFLIDLDAMRRYSWGWRARRAHWRDIDRFLENWSDRPELQALFRRLLTSAIA